MMRPLRWAALTSAVAMIWLLAEIAAAFMQQPLGEGGRALVGFPWGRMTLYDLYGGLALVSVWIALTERSRWAAAGWIAAVLLLGNVATCALIAKRAWRGQTWQDVIFPQTQ
jgi:hypothetical protein